MLASQVQAAHMQVADEAQLLGRVSCRLGFQGRQLIAAKHPRLRHEKDAVLAVLHHCTARVVLPTHWHLHSAMPWRLHPANMLCATISLTSTLS